MNVEVVQRRLWELAANSGDDSSAMECGGIHRGTAMPSLIKAIWKAGCREILHVRFGVGAQAKFLGLHHYSRGTTISAA
mgnify:CR=1 FL=1